MPSAGSSTRSCSSASTRSCADPRPASAWPRSTRSRLRTIRGPTCPDLIAALDDPVADVRVAAARILAAFETAPPGVARSSPRIRRGPRRPRSPPWSGTARRCARRSSTGRAGGSPGRTTSVGRASRSVTPRPRPRPRSSPAILEHRELDLANLALGALSCSGRRRPGRDPPLSAVAGHRDPGAGHRGPRSIGEPRLSGALVGLLEEAPAEPQDRADALRRLADDDDPWIARVARTISTGGADMPETSRTLGDLETMLFLRRVPLFEGLDPEDLQRIASTAIEHVYPAGERAGPRRRRRRHPHRHRRGLGPRGEGRTRRLRTTDPHLRGGRPHRRARGPTRGATRGDRPGRGRRRPRAGHRRRIRLCLRRGQGPHRPLRLERVVVRGRERADAAGSTAAGQISFRINRSDLGNTTGSTSTSRRPGTTAGRSATTPPTGTASSRTG